MDLKLLHMKMTDEMTSHDTAGHEIAGHEITFLNEINNHACTLCTVYYSVVGLKTSEIKISGA